MKFIFLQFSIVSLLFSNWALAEEGTLQQLENSAPVEQVKEPVKPAATAAKKAAEASPSTPPSLKDLNPNAAKVEKPRKAGEENLLSFEEEVIEGEKKRPELFLDIKAGDGNLGSGLYKRANFDDFFEVDRIRRPRFVKAK